MNDNTPRESDSANAGAAGLDLTALQRRRLLLRGVGKGGAVLAAAVPLASFANAPILKTVAVDGKAHLCAVSGMQSTLASSAPASGTCSGQSAVYWSSDAQKWPAIYVNQKNVGRQTHWYEVFGGGKSGDGALTFEQLLAPGAPAAKQTWVRAMLNAGAGYPAGTFPYQPADVLKLYKDPAKRTDAQTFFRDWV